MSSENNSVKVGIILASTREGRRGEGFAKWIEALIAERPGVETELFDLRDYPLGAYTYEQMPPMIERAYKDETARSWSEKIWAQDAYVIVTPEYNHGYPGNLKNAMDHVFMGWWYKPVGFVGYGGGAAGARAVEQLRNVAVELRMVPVRGEVNIRLMGLSLDENRAPADPVYRKQAGGLIEELLWWAKATKRARQEGTPGF